MGARTLEDFREDLSTVLGGRGPSNRWLDRRINAAYLDVATSLLHEVLRHCAKLTVSSGTSIYGIGEDVIGVISVTNPGEKKVLVNTENENMDIYDPSKTGEPRLWADRGKAIRIWPVPDKEYTLEVSYFREPPILSSDDDTTLLEARWDQAVHLMACHYAFEDLDQAGPEGRAMEYLARAQSYIGSRMKDSDVRRSPSMPTPVPGSFQELTRMRTSL